MDTYIVLVSENGQQLPNVSGALLGSELGREESDTIIV